VVKLHGSDINSIAKAPGPARLLRLGATSRGGVVAVSNALGDEAAEPACARSDRRRDHGVDARCFSRAIAPRARAALGSRRPLAVYIGISSRKKALRELAAWPASRAACPAHAGDRRGGRSVAFSGEPASIGSDRGPQRSSSAVRAGGGGCAGLAGATMKARERRARGAREGGGASRRAGGASRI